MNLHEDSHHVNNSCVNCSCLTPLRHTASVLCMTDVNKNVAYVVYSTTSNSYLAIDDYGIRDRYPFMCSSLFNAKFFPNHESAEVFRTLYASQFESHALMVLKVTVN